MIAKCDITVYGVKFKNVPLRPKRRLTRRKEGIRITVEKCGIINWFLESKLTLADPSVINNMPKPKPRSPKPATPVPTCPG